MCDQKGEIWKKQGLLPFEIEYIPDNFLKQAEVELNETPAKRMHNIRMLRDMMKKDETFVGEEFDDRFLLQYLRFRKHDVDKALSVLKRFVVFRRKYRDMFSNINFSAIIKLVSQEIVTVLPCRCPEGCAIMLIQLDNWDPENLEFKDFRSGGMILLSQSIREPLTQITGFKVIVDVRSNPLKHLKYCTFSNLYQLYHGTQETSSGRFKSIHILNNSVTFKTGWSMMKPFLPEKIKSRAHFHSNPEELFQFFPRPVIPTKYGGYLQNYDMSDWFRRATEYDEVAVLLGLPPKPNKSNR